MCSKGLHLRLPNTLAGSFDTLDLSNIISSLRLCRDIALAKSLHAHISSNGLDTLSTVGNHLVLAFLACGNTSDTQHIINRLQDRRIDCWSSLISGFMECGLLRNAISLYHQEMQEESNVVLLALLKSCTRSKAVEEGRDLHNGIIQKGLEHDVFIGSTLVDMYAKYGSVVEARSVFDSMCERNVVSWNALIAGYVNHEAIEEVVYCFHQMQTEGVAVDVVTCTSILKACHIIGDICMGMEVHGKIMEIGFEQDIYVGSSLISMYAKCGLLKEAWEIFDKLRVRDAVLWTTLLAGCVEQGAGQEALKHFEQMRQEGILPTPYVYSCGLKACGNVEMVQNGREIHLEVVKRGCEDDVYVGSSLVDMYAKHGLLCEGRTVLDNIPERNVFSWNALIAGYAEFEPGSKVLDCIEQMLLEHVSPDAVTLACCLKSCSSTRTISIGHNLHAETMHKGLENDVLVGTALVDMYANSGFLLEAQEILEKMAVRTVVSWNVLMAGYAEHGSSQQTLQCFEEMKRGGVSSSPITLNCILEACGKMGCLDKGQEVHSEVIEKGFEKDYYVGNVLVSLYAKHGFLTDARQIFEKLPLKSFESWTAMISGCAEYEWSPEALSYFEQMRSEGVFQDSTLFVCVLKACCSIKAVEKGQEVHIEILKRGFETDSFIGSTLVNMYCKCGLLAVGHEIFHKLPDQNVISWNALIGGYSEHGMPQLALDCYDAMHAQNVSPSVVTFVSVLKACCKVGAIEKGREIHKDLRQKGFEKDSFVASALILMYAGCGSISEAWEAFNKLPVQSVVSWNTMLKGFGMNHEGDMALCLFKEMRQQGVEPDAITFMCLLATCSRASLIQDGGKYFKTMMQDYNIVPTLEHLTCMVDVLARSGHLLEADKLFEFLPHLPSKAMWTILLSACQTYVEVELAEHCFQQLVAMDQDSAVPYSLMASIYASSGRWDDVKRIQELRNRSKDSAIDEINRDS